MANKITNHVLQLVERYTRGTFDINTLRGPSYTYCRQQIIEAVTGERHPKSVCYISRLRGFLMDAYNMYDNPKCLAAMEQELIEVLKNDYVKANTKRT